MEEVHFIQGDIYHPVRDNTIVARFRRRFYIELEPEQFEDAGVKILDLPDFHGSLGTLENNLAYELLKGKISHPDIEIRYEETLDPVYPLDRECKVKYLDSLTGVVTTIFSAERRYCENFGGSPAYLTPSSAFAWQQWLRYWLFHTHYVYIDYPANKLAENDVREYWGCFPANCVTIDQAYEYFTSQGYPVKKEDI